MRRFRWTHALSLTLGLIVFAQGALLLAQDEEAELEAERKRIAAEALEKAVARGKELWKDKRVLGQRKACADCHEDPEKPQLDMTTREWSYPAYSRRKRAVVTLQQKINEMIQYQGRGKPLDADSTDLAALAAYVTSVHKR